MKKNIGSDNEGRFCSHEVDQELKYHVTHIKVYYRAQIRWI